MRGRRLRGDLPQSDRSVGYIRPRRAVVADRSRPLILESGASLEHVEAEYEVYGPPLQASAGVILVCHALSGDAHAAGWDETAAERGLDYRLDRPGWWDQMIGPFKALDTRVYSVVCSNILGSCYGTTGPSSIDPKTDEPYGLTFPVVTVGDWVEVQNRLIEHLGVDCLLAVVGGSLGGQQALEWAIRYPSKVDMVAVIAASDRLSDQGLAFNSVARHAIMTDPNYREGQYYAHSRPEAGLSVARRLAHITYLSQDSMEQRFGRRYRSGGGPGYQMNAEFEVESYLDHQGESFVRRFDANSYLYITKAMDYYDAARTGGSLEASLSGCRSRFLVASVSSDWLYPPGDIEVLSLALARCGKDVTYAEIPSKAGHDGFLVEVQSVSTLVSAFIEGRRRAL